MSQADLSSDPSPAGSGRVSLDKLNHLPKLNLDYRGGSNGKESACNAGGPGSPQGQVSRCQTQPWYPQCLLSLFKWADDKLADPALPFPSHGNQSRGSCPQFLPLLLPQDWPLWFPGCPTPTHGVTRTSSLRICWVEETVFQWPLSWHLLALPYLNNNKTY